MIILRETKARKCCSGVSRFQLTNSDISNQSFIIIVGYATCHINRDFDGSLARHGRPLGRAHEHRHGSFAVDSDGGVASAREGRGHIDAGSNDEQ